MVGGGLSIDLVRAISLSFGHPSDGQRCLARPHSMYCSLIARAPSQSTVYTNIDSSNPIERISSGAICIILHQ